MRQAIGRVKRFLFQDSYLVAAQVKIFELRQAQQRRAVDTTDGIVRSVKHDFRINYQCILILCLCKTKTKNKEREGRTKQN